MNIFNFMDGINGITGGYTIIVLAVILYTLNSSVSIQSNSTTFVINSLVKTVLLADIVFVFLISVNVLNVFREMLARCQLLLLFYLHLDSLL